MKLKQHRFMGVQASRVRSIIAGAFLLLPALSGATQIPSDTFYECKFIFSDVKTVGISVDPTFMANASLPPFAPSSTGLSGSSTQSLVSGLLGLPAQSYQLELVGSGVIDTSPSSGSLTVPSPSGASQPLQISAVGPGPFVSFTPIVDSCRQNATLALHNPIKYGLQVILRSGTQGCGARSSEGQPIANRYDGKLAQCAVVRIPR